jgi:hypothetical protein
MALMVPAMAAGPDRYLSFDDEWDISTLIFNPCTGEDVRITFLSEHFSRWVDTANGVHQQNSHVTTNLSASSPDDGWTVLNGVTRSVVVLDADGEEQMGVFSRTVRMEDPDSDQWYTARTLFHAVNGEFLNGYFESSACHG